MIEFNPDGSIKIPGRIAEGREKREQKLKKERCILIRKELVNASPKKCILHLTLSEAISDNSFVENLFRRANEATTVSLKLTKINDKNFEIEVGSDFKRCSDCNAVVSIFRDFLDGNIIEDKGSCTLKERSNFSYEDYF